MFFAFNSSFQDTYFSLYPQWYDVSFNSSFQDTQSGVVVPDVLVYDVSFNSSFQDTSTIYHHYRLVLVVFQFLILGYVGGNGGRFAWGGLLSIPHFRIHGWLIFNGKVLTRSFQFLILGYNLKLSLGGNNVSIGFQFLILGYCVCGCIDAEICFKPFNSSFQDTRKTHQ